MFLVTLLEIFFSYKKLMVISFKIFMELLSTVIFPMSSITSHPTTGTESSTGGSSKASTGAKTAADLVAALKKARADKAAADAAAAAAKAAADAQAANSLAAADKTAARDKARAAAQAADQSKAAAKLVLHQQRITEAAAARAAAAAAAKAARLAAYNEALEEWKEKLDAAKKDHDAFVNGTGSYTGYFEAIPYARDGNDFDKLCADCQSETDSVATAACALKKLVKEYQKLLAEKAKAVKELKAKEPKHPDVVFQQLFESFIENNPKLMNRLSSLLEGRDVCSTFFVAAGLDPNFLGMFGGLFVLSSANDTVSLNWQHLPQYDPSKDKAKAGRDEFHLWWLQRVIFGFIQNCLVPLVNPSSGLTLEVLMLNFKHLLPKHIVDRDAQIAEHSANITATMEWHLRMKEKRRGKIREATEEEFKEFERECEEHSQKEAAEAAKSRELADSLKAFLQAEENATLWSNLQSFGIQDSEAAWNNQTAPTHALKQFLAANGLSTFCDSIRFLQEAGFIANEVSTIPTKRNPIREAFAFIFGKDAKSSSDSEDEHVEPAVEPAVEHVAEKEQKPSKKILRILQRQEDFEVLAREIEAAEAEKARLASQSSSEAEDSSAKEPTEATLPRSPPAPVFPARHQFFLSHEAAAAIAAENGVGEKTISLVAMLKGVQSLSAASNSEVIMAAKHIEARIEAEKEKAAKEAAQKFKDKSFNEKKEALLARLAQRRSASVGGGASASNAVVPPTEGDGRLTLEQAISNHKGEMGRQCGEFFSRMKTSASKKDAPQSAEQSAEPQSAEENK